MGAKLPTEKLVSEWSRHGKFATKRQLLDIQRLADAATGLAIVPLISSAAIYFARYVLASDCSLTHPRSPLSLFGLQYRMSVHDDFGTGISFFYLPGHPDLRVPQQ